MTMQLKVRVPQEYVTALNLRGIFVGDRIVPAQEPQVAPTSATWFLPAEQEHMNNVHKEIEDSRAEEIVVEEIRLGKNLWPDIKVSGSERWFSLHAFKRYFRLQDLVSEDTISNRIISPLDPDYNL